MVEAAGEAGECDVAGEAEECGGDDLGCKSAWVGVGVVDDAGA